MGLWKHYWQTIMFTLYVDNFGVKYLGEEKSSHLMRVLKKKYKISHDPYGKRYLDLYLDWDNNN